MLRRFIGLVALFCAALLFAAEAKPKYIILFIGDGMSVPQRMVAETYSLQSGRGRLAINAMPMQGTTTTNSSNAIITDSAAAATAIACGEKTVNGRLGLDPTGERRLQSVAELAKERGKKVGIITSVTINHATPAGFYAHRKSRGELYGIGLDLVASGFDFFGGGGLADMFNDQKAKDYQGNIYELAEKAGYKVIREDKAAFEALQPGMGKVFVVGKEGTLPYMIDYDASTFELSELTAKAIAMLEDSPTGFFLMVESGKIDYAGHANDAAANLKEVLVLDKSVKCALDFQAKHPDETLVVVTGDHETGAMSMGFAGTGGQLRLQLLDNQKCSVGVFDEKLKAAQKNNENFSFEDAKAMLTEYFGFDFTNQKSPMFVKEETVKKMEQAFKGELDKTTLPAVARQTISGLAGVSWASGGHSALPVLTTAKGVGAEIFEGSLDNTDISKKLKELL